MEKEKKISLIPQSEPWFDEKEAKAVYAYVKNGGWITEFKKTKEFEKEIANFTKAKYCVITTNGTISLTLALLACGIRKGDEIIVPDMTMVATPNSVKLTGASVVFSDIEKESLCLSMETITPHLTKRTKAIILVSLNGRYPKDIKKIVSFCKKNKIWLIEDAAQSLGSFRGKKHIGTYGDIGSFSFSSPKIISTGQGGALITNNKQLYERLKKLKDFGREKSGADHYLTMGWNFKFTDIQAVIGIEQMKKLSWRIKRKREIYKLYKENLQDLPDISFVETNIKETTPWFIDIMVHNNQKNLLIKFLKEKNIGTRPIYPALHNEPVYNLKKNFPISETIAKEGLWLPSSSKLTNAQIKYICSQIKKFFTIKK